MAAKYRKIDPRIWTDENFTRLDVQGKVLTFWLLTSTRVNRCGIVQWSPGLASEETGIPATKIDTVCDTVCDTLEWVRDRVSRTVFLRRWWRYNQPDNEKALIGALSDLHDLPINGLKQALIEACGDLRPELHTVYMERLDTVSHTVSYTVSPQEQEQEQEQEQDILAASGDNKNDNSRERQKKFTPPTIEDVATYCEQRQNGIDATAFVAYYTARGWMLGKSKMKNWRAAIVTWEKNQADRKPPVHDEYPDL